MALIVCCALSFGMITTFAHLAYDAGAVPLLLVFGRFLGFTLIVGGFLFGSGRGAKLPKRNFKATFALAVPMMMMSAGYLASVAYIAVNLAVILLYSFPLMVTVLAAVTGKERMTPAKVLTTLTAFGGLVIAVGGDFGALDWRGVAFVLTAAFGIAGTLTWAAPYLDGVDTFAVNFWTNLWMLIAAGAWVLVFGGLAYPAGLLGWGAVLGATLCYTLGYSLFFAAMKRLPPAEAAVMLNTEPIVSMTAASLLLGEATRTAQWVGVAIMLAALCFSALRGARSET
jgi:drug/metabolite transporter (DMT)-like permease